jgi:hypothetical protein
MQRISGLGFALYKQVKGFELAGKTPKKSHKITMREEKSGRLNGY